MSKKKLTLLINEDLKKRAKNYGINLSAFLEIKLEEHLALLHGRGNVRLKCGRRELNPGRGLGRP